MARARSSCRVAETGRSEGSDVDSLLIAAFVLGLPVWLVVEQIFVMLRSPRPAVRPVITRVAPAGVIYQSR